jgi:hypothetical protein
MLAERMPSADDCESTSRLAPKEAAKLIQRARPVDAGVRLCEAAHRAKFFVGGFGQGGSSAKGTIEATYSER